MDSKIQDKFTSLNNELKLFTDKSITKSVFKPVRDNIFHNPLKFIKSYLLKNKNFFDIEISNLTSTKGEELLETRYLFADVLVSRLSDMYINDNNDEIINKSSKISIDILSLVDAIMAKFIETNEQKKSFKTK